MEIYTEIEDVCDVCARACLSGHSVYWIVFRIRRNSGSFSCRFSDESSSSGKLTSKVTERMGEREWNMCAGQWIRRMAERRAHTAQDGDCHQMPTHTRTHHETWETSYLNTIKDGRRPNGTAHKSDRPQTFLLYMFRPSLHVAPKENQLFVSFFFLFVSFRFFSYAFVFIFVVVSHILVYHHLPTSRCTCAHMQ